LVRLFPLGRFSGPATAFLNQIKNATMKNIKLTSQLVILFLLLLPVFARSQFKLTGRVNDAQKTPIAWANVILLGTDGKMVNGTTTKEDGSFVLQNKGGSFSIKISAIGYADFQQNLLLQKDTVLGSIELKAATHNLSDVTVVGRKKLVQYKPNGLVFDVQSSIAASGGDAINAISSAPGIILQNNTISMLGKGASRVMIDGRLVELSGEELVSFLKSISAGDIKNIEVITNPSAKYEAAGNGGIININMKKGQMNSWKNSATLAYNKTAYGAVSLNDNFLYNNYKVKFSLSAGGSLGYSKIRQDLDTYYPSGPWNLRYTGKQNENKVSGRMALDYDITPHTTAGIQYFGSYNTPGTNDHTIMRIHNTSGELNSLLVNTGDRVLSSASQIYNTHLVSTLDTLQRKLSVDFDYFNYSSQFDNNFRAAVFTPQMNFIDNNQSAENISRQDIDNYSAKADMEHPLRAFKLGYGVKISTTRSSAETRYFNTMSGIPVLDPTQSNTFNYHENNQAVYISGAKDFGAKLSLDLGLRLENTQTSGYSATLNQTTKTSYLKLFPTAVISYKVNAANSFYLNYGRRINRPGFALLNPFRSYINSNSYSEGNPFLQPSFSDNFSFTHSYKGMLRTEVYFNMTSNGFGPVFTSNPVKNTLIITRENYYRGYDYGIGETLTAEITRWWQTQNSVYLLGSKTRFDSTINASVKDSPQLSLSSNNTFSIGNGTKAEVIYRYHTAFNKGLYRLGSSSVLNIGISQNLMKERLALSLFANDIFNNAYLRNYTSIVNGIKQVYNENNSSRYFRLTLVYNFGNSAIKIKQRDFGNDDERRRTN